MIENKYDNKYGDLAVMSTAVKGLVQGNKTGIFIFPKVGYVLSLKKGRLDGEMSLIREQDTLYYCVYKDNRPTGKYINWIATGSHSYGENYDMYYTFLTNIRSSIRESGIGFYNKNNKKEGFWDERGYCSVNEGTYVNGLRHGIWIEDCFNDGGALHTAKIIKYNNGVVVRSNVKQSKSRIQWTKGE